MGKPVKMLKRVKVLSLDEKLHRAKSRLQQDPAALTDYDLGVLGVHDKHLAELARDIRRRTLATGNDA
jgi:predicted metal-dependent HD superfamily phosphohydrolase